MDKYAYIVNPLKKFLSICRLTNVYNHGTMTMVRRIMPQVISKSQFKPKVLEYLRLVEQNKQPLTITHEGKPVVQVVPFIKDPQNALKPFRGTVKNYRKPTSPIGVKEWEALT